MGTEAVVHAAAERLDRWGAHAADVETVGVVADRGIPVGRPSVDDDYCAGGDFDAGDFDILDCGAQRDEGDRRMADELLDGIDRQLRMPAQECPLVGVIAQHVYRRTQLEAGGVGACQQQRGDEHAEFVGAEAIAIVLGADQLGDQVVGQCVPPVREHVVDVGVESIPGGQDRRRFIGGIPAESLQDVICPAGEQFPVFGRCAQ